MNKLIKLQIKIMKNDNQNEKKFLLLILRMQIILMLPKVKSTKKTNSEEQLE